MIHLRNACFCMILMLLSGCVTYEYGYQLDPNNVATIQRGVTTRGQVESLFGPPMGVSIISVGHRQLTYSFKEVVDNGPGSMFSSADNTDTRHQKLIIWTNDKDVVEDYEFTDYVVRVKAEGTAETVERAAVTTQPSAAPVWFPGGDDGS
jgi:outer membrane protein assembly factor BamE (lipoprotein component of BamABCDE complex)